MAAHEHGLPLAVQATGHGTVVAADGALLLVTSRLCGVEIDPTRRRARVGPGAVWAQVNAAAAQFGLGSLAGRCATVGVTGYTLGGGAGWLSRTFGFAADSVVRAEVVTADGRLVTASADEHPDLFWALRGGGGNFGIVTSLEFTLYPADRVFSGMSLYPLERAPETLAAYGSWALDEPEGMNSAVLLMRLPPHPSFPEPLRGRRVMAIRAFHLGSADEGRRVLAPLLEAAGPPLLDAFAMRPFPEASTATNGPDAPPMANRQHLDLLHTVRERRGRRHGGGRVQRTRRWPSSSCGTGVAPWPSRLPGSGPAGHRDVPFSVQAVGPYMTPDRQPVDTCVDRLAAAIEPHATGGSFLNLLTDPAKTRTAFTDGNYARLAQVKRAWDPDNVFHLNHNIPPA